MDLLAQVVGIVETFVGVGPWTSLALLEAARPVLLPSMKVVVLCGYVRVAGAGYPNWRADLDYNGQQDTLAARLAFARLRPTDGAAFRGSRGHVA